MKTLYKKSLIAIVALIIFTLSACSLPEQDIGDLPDENNKPVNLVLWHYYNDATKDALDELVAEFNSTVGKEKNITVEALSHSHVNDLANAVVASANHEVGVADMPDIFAAYSDTTLLLNDMGKVASIDEYFTPDEIALFKQDFLSEGRFATDEKLRILPVAKSTELLYINETDFQVFADDTGVELSQAETWEGLAEVAEIYYNWTDDKTPDVEGDGKALFGVDSEANFMLLAARQLGEEMYQYDGDSVCFGLSENAARKIWDTLLVPYIKGYYGAFGNYRSDDLKSGDLLMYAGSSSSLYYFPTKVELGRAEAYDINGIVMPYPYFEGGERVAVQQGAGMVVTKSDEIREAAAVEFLKWFTSAKNNLEFAVLTGYIPVQNDALSLDGIMSVIDDGEVANVVTSTLEVTYNQMLPKYEFYANKPFMGSYDTRNEIAHSMCSVISTEEDITKEQQADMIGDEAFAQWYNSLKLSIDTILNKSE